MKSLKRDKNPQRCICSIREAQRQLGLDATDELQLETFQLSKH